MTTEEDTVILDRAREIIYDRQAKYGKPEDSFKEIAKFWSDYLGIDVQPSDVGYMMILLKIARTMNDRDEEENLEDIAGYAENTGRVIQEDDN